MAIRTVPTERLVKPSEAAAMLGVHHNTVLTWIRDGKVPYVQTPGGHYLLPWSLLAQAMGGTYEVAAPLHEPELSEEEALERLRR